MDELKIERRKGQEIEGEKRKQKKERRKGRIEQRKGGE